MEKTIATIPLIVLLALIVVLISTVFLSLLGFDISMGNKPARAQSPASSSGLADLDEKQRLKTEMEFL